MTREAPPTGLARDSDWRLFWLSTTVSVFGSQVSALAIPLTAIESLDASAFQIGLLNASLSLPFLLIGLLAGAWIDRMRRRPVLIVSDLLRGLLLVSVPIAFLIGELSMVQLYAVGLLFGCLTVFFDVAYDAYVPALVGRERLVSANSMIEVSRSSAQVGGPGVAGLLIGIVGAPIAVLIDAVSFLLSGGLVVAIRRPETGVERPASAPGEGRVRVLAAEIGEGLRYVLGHRYLKAIAACTATFNFFFAAISALFLLYAVREIGLSVELIGLIFAVGSLGLFGGIWLASRLPPRIGVGPTIITGILISGPAGLIVPLAPAPLAVPLFIAFELLLGVGLMVLQHQSAQPAPGDHTAANAGAHDRNHALPGIRLNPSRSLSRRFGWRSDRVARDALDRGHRRIALISADRPIPDSIASRRTAGGRLVADCMSGARRLSRGQRTGPNFVRTRLQSDTRERYPRECSSHSGSSTGGSVSQAASQREPDLPEGVERMALIADRVELARRGANDTVICRLPSGWAVVGDVQFLAGYCLLLADPVVGSLNDLDDARCAEFLRDMAHLGDAILQVTSADRINYEILGNSEPELHAHVFPRYTTEPAELRRLPAWFYDWAAAPRYDAEAHAGLREALRTALLGDARPTPHP